MRFFSMPMRRMFRAANIQQRPDCFWFATASLSTSIENVKVMSLMTLSFWAELRMPFLKTARSVALRSSSCSKPP
ncbi:hypothetical protein EVA_18400 [gut metagenome]|uniref:Uncharacterized protein n=1 Tax=gut metagenome TaxID=749906 RepID=J9FV91_9ZZZZ